MEIIKVKNVEEDFQGFLKLEEDFNRYYEKLGIGGQYGPFYLKTSRYLTTRRNSPII